MKNKKEILPFVSLIIIFVSLFTLAFLKMEVRRKGYAVLKLVKSEKQLNDYYLIQSAKISKMTRPANITRVAKTQFLLRKARPGEIIQISGSQIALRE